MVHAYTPTYYTSLHDSITSMCKNILPFSFKKKRIPALAAAEQRLSKQQSDNLKWQQESFHQILNLMGLCKEGILPEPEVSAFKTHLLETLIAAPIDHESSLILRDKLIFLQELLYAKCISEDEYHESKRPLLQRLAVEGAEIEASDVIVGAQKKPSNDEWSVIDLKEEKNLVKPETSKSKSKEGSSIKKLKGAVSVLGFVSPDKNGKLEAKNVNTAIKNNSIRPTENNVLCQSTENPFWNIGSNVKESESNSILMMESSPATSMAEKQSGSVKGKRKPFKTLFQKEQKDCENMDVEEMAKVKPVKRTWGFDGFKKWKKNESADETAPLSLSEKSDGEFYYNGQRVEKPIGEGPDTKQMKKKLHPNGASTDFYEDKVVGDNMKKELSRIQTEFSGKNLNAHIPDDQIEAISTRLPTDKTDLKQFFPKCDRYGDTVLDHVEEIEDSRITVKEKNNSKRWTTFDDEEENSHPNLFATTPPPQENHSYSLMKQASFSASKNMRSSINSSSIDKGFRYNPFFDM